MPDVWGVMRAIRTSDLPYTDRHILMTLASLADPNTASIPDRFMPSLTELARFTGLGRSTVARRLIEIENAKWVQREQPSVQDAWGKKERTAYHLCIPVQVSTSPTTGLVPEGDQSQNGTSPAEGPGLVPERDSTSPAAGHEVPDLFTTTTKPSSSSAKPPKPKKTEPYREDVEQICKHLADRVIGNGSKATITNEWRKEGRLLLDEPRPTPVTVDKVIALIDWCQDDDFWSPNIRSMPTFRKQYDALRLKALNEYKQGRRNGSLGNANPRRLTNSHENQDRYDVKL